MVDRRQSKLDPALICLVGARLFSLAFPTALVSDAPPGISEVRRHSHQVGVTRHRPADLQHSAEPAAVGEVDTRR